MKKTFKLLIFLSLLSFISSCGPSQREKAAAKMDEADKLIEKGDTLKAIGILESIPSLFPNAKVQISVSRSRADEFFRQLIDARKEQLSTNEALISNLEKYFTKEKTEYDRYIQFNHNKLPVKNSWNKSFLQVTLDERGEIFLTSNYMGKDWLKHTALKIYDEGLQIKTPQVPLDDLNNRRSDFLDYKWEKVSYTLGKSDSTIRFIAKNINRQLKCAFMGSNYYYIILENYNKEAIKDAYELSCAIKNRKVLIKQIKELEDKRK
jgi:hypothetical protein